MRELSSAVAGVVGVPTRVSARVAAVVIPAVVSAAVIPGAAAVVVAKVVRRRGGNDLGAGRRWRCDRGSRGRGGCRACRHGRHRQRGEFQSLGPVAGCKCRCRRHSAADRDGAPEYGRDDSGAAGHPSIMRVGPSRPKQDESTLMRGFATIGAQAVIRYQREAFGRTASNCSLEPNQDEWCAERHASGVVPRL